MSTAVDETTETQTPEAPETAPEPEPEPATPEPAPEPEPDETPDETPDEDVPHSGPVTEAEHAQVFDKAIKRAKTYMQAVPVILGDSARELSLCPRCTDLLPGFILPPEIKPVTPDQKVAVKLSIGELAEPEYPRGRDTEPCPGCRGLGKVSTGSLVPTQAVLRCEDCQGRGWMGPRSARTAAAPVATASDNGLEPDAPVEEKPKADPWGRTIDDPLYGVMPGYTRD